METTTLTAPLSGLLPPVAVMLGGAMLHTMSIASLNKVQVAGTQGAQLCCRKDSALTADPVSVPQSGLLPPTAVIAKSLSA